MSEGQGCVFFPFLSNLLTFVHLIRLFLHCLSRNGRHISFGGISDYSAAAEGDTRARREIMMMTEVEGKLVGRNSDSAKKEPMGCWVQLRIVVDTIGSPMVGPKEQTWKLLIRYAAFGRLRAGGAGTYLGTLSLRLWLTQAPELAQNFYSAHPANPGLKFFHSPAWPL